ncbi:MAG: hypothetical protein EOM73_15445, partial [Bacteroidia bacterium]|nr:hypothetical protein [Bacteroidia bacterium]
HKLDDLYFSDFKQFQFSGHTLGISQITSADSEEFLSKKEGFLALMEQELAKCGYDMMLLMLTDVLKEGTLLLAVGVLYVPFIRTGFEFFGQIFVKILDFTKAGSEFLLGDLMNSETYGFIFLFQVLPTIIFFSALTSLLFYWGIIQKVVYALAWVFTKALKISGAEALSVAGNIFLGQTESPLMIKAYLEKMSKSEILLVMTGGMATLAGGVLAAYIALLGGDDPALRLEFAKHLLAASVMAAPAAIIFSKMLVPPTDAINKHIEVSRETIGSNVVTTVRFTSS